MKKLACLFFACAITVCCGCQLDPLVNRIGVASGTGFVRWLESVATVGYECRQAVLDAWTATAQE